VIAAIYARKSTDQTGVADEQKSIVRQIEHAREYAVRKGWTVEESEIYVDDGISGAEFDNRPGFTRLMNSLKPRARVQVLVMSEESRLGREAIQTAYTLKQLVQAGVRVFFYLEDRERTLDSPMDKVMMALAGFGDEVEREKGRQRTYDAMIRKARAGHVTGGRVFGYENVEVLAANGKRSHVERRIHPEEAGVVRRIFELCAAGAGLTCITKTLNAERALAPRPQQGRPAAWAPSSVREVLERPLYRGEIVWNRSRKRDTWGQARPTARPKSTWVRLPAPSLQIVSDHMWSAAQAARIRRQSQYSTGGRGHRASRFLLSGFARCASCAGGFASHSRTHGARRAHFYACTTHWKRGPEACSNGLVARMDAIDREVLATLQDDILRPSVIERAVALALEELSPRRQQAATGKLERELLEVRAECDRLAVAIGSGGPLDALLARLTTRQARRVELEGMLAAARTVAPTPGLAIEQGLRSKLADWRGLLTRNVESGRDVLRALLVGPLNFTPVLEGRRRGYTFEGVIALDRLVSGVITLPALTGVASPAGHARSWTREVPGEVKAA
jgi:DNA invertase Pin-like site-specific DNA recombinase